MLMKKITLILSGVFVLTSLSAQRGPWFKSSKAQKLEKTLVIPCSEFHITRPLTEIVKDYPVDENFKKSKMEESEDRENRKPQKFKFSAKDGSEYGNDPATVQTEMGNVQGKAPIQNWLGQNATAFRPMDPSGAAGPNHYVQMINSTTFRVYNKATGATMLTASLGSLWAPATANDGDPIVMYDKAADRWFLAQFGSAGNNMYIAISTTNNPTGTYYTYTFSSPDFPDYLKFSTWADGYYMTGNYAQKVFCFERAAMLAGTPTARSIYKTFSPPDGGGFFVPLPGDASDGTLPAVGTPCPIFSYSDNNWGAGFTDAINIYKMAVTWGTTPAATITSAGTVATAAFDATYDGGWNDVSQPGTTQKLDGIGGVLMYRAQFKIWSGYNSVVLTWAVKISATQRSLKWCELRQSSTGVWSMYQEGIYTPDTDTRWLGSIAMDNNGAIGLAYLKANSTSTYPGLYYTGRRSCDPLGTLPVTESVAQAGTGSQTGVNRDGDYAQMSLDPDGITFWYTGEYMGGTTGGSAARTRIFSFQLPTCGPAAPVANFTASNTTPCIGSTVTLTDISTNTPTSWAWTFSPTTVTYVGGTTSASQNPQVQFNAAGPYTVTLVATNTSGNDSEVKTAYISPITTGTLPLVENFEGATFPPTGWSVNNPDAPSIAWGTAGAKGLERRAAAGNTGSATGSAGIEFYNYNTDTTQIDELISKPVSLVGASAPRMTFKRAYKYYNDAAAPTKYHDELRVFISTDCGLTYGSAVYYKKGAQLASNGTSNTSFTPAVAADWDIDTVNLTSYVGQNIIVKFQVTNRYGNNLYLDDVNINSNASVASVTIASNDADNTICAGTSVTFTATPTNGGTAPVYQWQVNGSNVGTNSPTYTTTALTNGQIVTVIMTSNLSGVTGSPATSNAITMTVTTPPVATFSYTASPYCSNAANPSPTFSGGGTAGTFTSTAGLVFVSAATGQVNLAGSTPGTYTVTNTKPAAGGCSAVTATSTITITTLPVATFSYTASPYCQNAANPSPTFSGGGSAGTFTSTTGLVFVSATTGQINLTASTPGTYTVTNTKAAANGCPSITATATITITAVPVATFSYTSSPYCSNAANPSPTFSGGGSAGTFTSTTGLVFVSAATGQINLAASTAGTYTVTNTKAAAGGCAAVTATASITIKPTPVATVPANITVCNGANVPATNFTSTPTGATFAWTNTNTSIGLAASGSGNLPAFTANNVTTSPVVATISVTPTLNGCTGAAVTFTITVNPQPTSTFTQSPNQCLSGNSFNFTNTGSGGAGITQTWTFAGGTPASSTVISPTGVNFTTVGTHSITHVTTGTGGCSSTTTSTITIYSAPTAQAITTTSTACGASTGTITLGATTGGTGPYTFSVNGSAFTTTTSYTGFASGSYPVIVKDANGCQFTTSATISNSSGPTSQATTTVNSTCGNANGVINVGSTTGGAGPYSFSLNGGAFTTSTSFTGLTAGTYSLVVKDANGCMFTTSVTVSNTAGPTGIVTTTNSTCGNSNGTATVSVSGGTPNYSYSWTPGGQMTQVASGLSSGTYTITVSDINACTFTATAIISNTAGPSAASVTTSSSSCGAANGGLVIGTVTGGTPPYTYSVNGGSFTTNTTYTNLSAGTYPVVVTDANGCTFSTSATISNTGTAPSTPTISQLGLDLTSSSATGNQWYLNGALIPGATGQMYTATSNGSYTVVVTTGGCSSAASAPVVITSVGIVDLKNDPYGLLIYPNPNDGNFNISFTSTERSNYRIEIVNALGQLIFKDDLKDFSGHYNKQMSVVEYGQGIYTISLTNSKNETVKKIVVY
jgi:PKD repeat protein